MAHLHHARSHGSQLGAPGIGHGDDGASALPFERHTPHIPGMSVQALEAQPSRQAVQAKTASKPRRVTGSLAVACKLVIEEGLELDEAAKRAGLTTRALRLAIERPHVINWMKAQREVFRAYICAQNIHTLREVRNDKANKMARVQAVRTLEGMSDDEPGSRGGMAQVAGFVIVLREGAPQQAPMVDVTPVETK